MKKSLVLISFAFIFLLSVSFVSANFFDWITGDGISRGGGTVIQKVAVGDTKSIGDDYNVEINSVTKGGIVEVTVTNTKTRLTEQISSDEGETILSDGAVLSMSDIKKPSLFRKGEAKITVKPSDNLLGTTTACETLTDGATTPVAEGVETNVNGHRVLIADSVITLDGIFSSSLPSEGANVPIPSLNVYWKVTSNPEGGYIFVTKAYVKKCKSDRDCLSVVGVVGKCNLETGVCVFPVK